MSAGTVRRAGTEAEEEEIVFNQKDPLLDWVGCRAITIEPELPFGHYKFWWAAKPSTRGCLDRRTLLTATATSNRAIYSYR